MRPATVIFAAAASLTVHASPAAAQYECKSSIEQYNSALNEISSYMRRYSNCIANSRGADDCSFEFRRLRNAQMEFESAVSGLKSYCEN